MVDITPRAVDAIPPAEVPDVELYHPHSWWTTYVFSQDAKVIAIQYSGTAIAIGGPGAAFWMVVAGFLGMSTKFAEVTLAVKYRKVRPDGTVTGGAMYYVSEALQRRGLPRLGKFLAGFFCVAAVGGSLTIFQVNQAYAQFRAVTGFEYAFVFGLVVAVWVGVVLVIGLIRLMRTELK